jgi:hypothetical protein
MRTNGFIMALAWPVLGQQEARGQTYDIDIYSRIEVQREAPRVTSWLAAILCWH